MMILMILMNMMVNYDYATDGGCDKGDLWHAHEVHENGANVQASVAAQKIPERDQFLVREVRVRAV